jgi:microcystin degradation protein MlrC
MARATPSGVIDDEALETFITIMLEGIDKAGRLDGLLVAPHGAAISQSHPDMDGHWLSVVREKFGPDRPIIMTLDLHTNLSKKMIDATDATVMYRANPHLDQRERGIEAAELMVRTLKGQIKPTQAASFPPVAINIERQHTFEEPCLSLYKLAEAQRARPGVLTSSIALGFAYSDVPEMGSSFVCVTDNDKQLAQKYADEMADYLLAHRHDFVAVLTPPEEAVAKALLMPGPVCMLDMGDNVGGGGGGDGVVIANVIHKRGGPRTFTCLWDPQAAAAARQAGQGASIRLSMGAKTSPVYGPPLICDVKVVRLHDGKFTEQTVTHWGMTEFDMGPTAIVETASGLTIQLTTNRTYPTSLNQLTCCGLDPAEFHIIIAKGVHAPIGAYMRACRSKIRVNTPGFTTADLSALTLKHRRTPLIPFEELPQP